MKTQLTASESAKLIELGVSPERASEICMDFNGSYAYVHGEEAQLVRDCVNGHFYVDECRIFTLADILDILPKEVKIHRDGDNLSMIYHCGQWRVGYTNCAEYCNHTKVASELIDALYSLLVWCLEKGYVKQGEKEMKNPFRTRYRARKYMLDAVHRVEYKRWWQRKWRTHGIYATKEEAVLALKRLKQ